MGSIIIMSGSQCEPTCQAEVWSIFTAILKKSVRNLQACTDTALINLVLDRVAHTDSMIAGTATVTPEAKVMRSPQSSVQYLAC